MAKFGEVVDVDTVLDYGKHLVKISDVKNKHLKKIIKKCNLIIFTFFFF